MRVNVHVLYVKTNLHYNKDRHVTCKDVNQHISQINGSCILWGPSTDMSTDTLLDTSVDARPSISRYSIEYRSIYRSNTNRCIDRYSYWSIYLADTWPIFERYLTNTWLILHRYFTSVYTQPTRDRYRLIYRSIYALDGDKMLPMHFKHSDICYLKLTEVAPLS